MNDKNKQTNIRTIFIETMPHITLKYALTRRAVHTSLILRIGAQENKKRGMFTLAEKLALTKLGKHLTLLFSEMNFSEIKLVP
jgi:hypothetical protein